MTKTESVINVTSRGKWPANVVSNFAATPFSFGGVRCSSAESVIQALKFSTLDEHLEVCTLLAKVAKRRGRAKAKTMTRPEIWWMEQEIGFGSSAHYELIEQLLRAKFRQSQEAQRALLAVNGGPKVRRGSWRSTSAAPC